ncbi:MAG: efflux RND transporter periplasmic adaptor subunit [Pseudomonadota bacterium]
MIRKLFVVAGACAIALFFAGVIVIMGAMRPQVETTPAEPVAPIAFVRAVEYAPMNLSVRTQGEVAPRREIILSAEIAGRIREVSSSFANGGVFAKGDVLIRIEDADYRLAVTRAKSQVASAKQRLAVEEAEAALAAQDYEELSGGNAGDAPSILALRKPQLAAAQADLAAAEADLADAELALARTKIVAPFDGRVRSIGADVGQYVTPGAQLGQVFSTSVAEIRLPLTDDDLSKLDLPFAFESKGDDAPIVMLSANVGGTDYQWEGRIRRVDAAIDTSTRQIAAIAEVEDPYGAGSDDGFPLAFGLFVTAEIKGPTLPRATTVPLLSMRNDGQVFIVDEANKLALRTPQIAARAGEVLIAVAGLETGDLLVISPVTVGIGQNVRPLFEGGESARTLVDLTTGSTETASADGVDDGASL